MLKKKVIGFILIVISFFLVYIGLNIYQTKNIEIIGFEDIKRLKISESNSISEETKILGKADIGRYESVSMTNKIIVEDSLYLIVYKWPSFLNDNEIDISLENVDGLDYVKKISIVWGDIYSSEGSSRGISHKDLVNHPDQEIIWQKEGGDFE